MLSVACAGKKPGLLHQPGLAVAVFYPGVCAGVCAGAGLARLTESAV